MAESLFATEITRGAWIEPTGKYRYLLWREWEPSAGRVLWVMLNPSTADAAVDDPTIGRVIRFTRDWGFGAADVVNLFAFRATNPKALRRAADPIGRCNDAIIAERAAVAELIVVAWGAFPHLDGRDKAVLEMLPNPRCLGRTNHGAPKHPLYLPTTTKLQDMP